jgi:hypothetical protein
MDPSFMSGYAKLFLVMALGLGLVWPFLVVWLIYRFTHDLRRIASALERMEQRQIVELASAPHQIPPPPLEILGGRPVANSMFGR